MVPLPTDCGGAGVTAMVYDAVAFKLVVALSETAAGDVVDAFSFAVPVVPIESTE